MIRDFITQLTSRSLARTNRYTVSFGTPAGITIGDGTETRLGSSEDQRLISLFCDSLVLPGIDIESAALRIYGESREMPYSIAYQPAMFNFYVDSDLMIKKLFEDWMHFIFDPKSRVMAYQKTYTTQVVITVFGVDENVEKYKIVLHDAWPKSMGTIQMDTTSRDVMRLPVVFQYKSWERLATPAGTAQDTGVDDKANLDLLRLQAGLPLAQ